MSTKILIQIATKLGAVPWTVTIPLKKGTTMVVGFDTYHEKVGDYRGESVGALVSKALVFFIVETELLVENSSKGHTR